MVVETLEGLHTVCNVIGNENLMCNFFTCVLTLWLKFAVLVTL